MAGHVLVCVTGQKTCEKLIVEGARIAKENEALLSVLHVVKPGASLLGSATEGEALEYLFRIATQHDADMAMIRSDDIAGTIAGQVEKLGADVLVLGRSRNQKEKSVTQLMTQRLPNVSVQLVYS
ncbi:MAG: universal stress protein [Clostridia bacterium]|nr:universal stress protein [Clostridia bacterium]